MSSTTTTPGWQEDIVGILAPFTAQMMWRLNLGDYDAVVPNALIIYQRISTQDMPPPPFPPLPDAQVATFLAWLVAGCPQTRGGPRNPNAPPAPAVSAASATLKAAAPAAAAAPQGTPTATAAKPSAQRIRIP